MSLLQYCSDTYQDCWRQIFLHLTVEEILVLLTQSKNNNVSVIIDTILHAILDNNFWLEKLTLHFNIPDNIIHPVNWYKTYGELVEGKVTVSVSCYMGLLTELMILVHNGEKLHHTHLLAACRHNRINIVKWLVVDKQMDPNDNTNIVLRTACCYNSPPIVEFLLSCPNIDPTYSDGMFNIVVSRNHQEIVSLLLQDSRIDPSIDDNQAIKTAAKNGYLEIVKLLLQDPRVDPCADNNYALYYAEQNGHTEIAQLIRQDKRYHDTSIRINQQVTLLFANVLSIFVQAMSSKKA